MQTFKLSAFAIIFNDQKEVLLCHRRDHDLWNLPGGGVQKDETPWEAVVREAKEETGFDVVVEKLSGVYFKTGQETIAFAFVCRIKSGTLTLNDEADDIKYFSLEKIPDNFSAKQKGRIKDALANSEVVMKTETGPSSIELTKNSKVN